MFLTICMHLFGWLSEGGGNFLNLLQKEGVPRRGEGFPQKREVSFLEETMACWWVLSPGYSTCDMGQAQGTNSTILPTSDIRTERCPGYGVSFMTKY